MIATGLAQNGAKVYIVSRKDCSPFANRIGAVALQCDVAVKSEVERLMAELSTREGRLDILVNNAGTNYNAKIDQHDFAMFEKVLAVNTSAVFLTTQLALPLLRAAGLQGMTALGQMGSPADAAGVVLYLSGMAGAGVTGATILVDSGALVF